LIPCLREILPRYQLPSCCLSLLFVPSVKASCRSRTKSFHIVVLGCAWLGYRNVACCCKGWEYLGFVTHSAKCVPALLVMSANVVTWR
jgi:hypothetical protein